MNEDPARTVAWYQHALRTEARHKGNTWDPFLMARFYDYVARLDEPGEPSALLRASYCFQAQRAFRRAIESWSHFWEVFEMWEAWNGNVVGWVTLPY